MIYDLKVNSINWKQVNTNLTVFCIAENKINELGWNLKIWTKETKDLGI